MMILGNLFNKHYQQLAPQPNTKSLIIRSVGKLLFLISLVQLGHAQDLTSDITPISVEDDHDFSGYDLLEIQDQRLFVLAEHWHNIQSVPKATLKLLQFLHGRANVRILAIEHGKSVASMINQYLETGNEEMLKHITRNTMFWGQENA